MGRFLTLLVVNPKSGVADIFPLITDELRMLLSSGAGEADLTGGRLEPAMVAKPSRRPPRVRSSERESGGGTLRELLRIAKKSFVPPGATLVQAALCSAVKREPYGGERLNPSTPRASAEMASMLSSRESEDSPFDELPGLAKCSPRTFALLPCS